MNNMVYYLSSPYYFLSTYKLFTTFLTTLFLSFLSIFQSIDARTGRDTCPVIELSLLLSGDVVSNSHFYITIALHIQHDAQVYKLFLAEMLRHTKTLTDKQLSHNVVKRNLYILKSLTH